MHKRQVHRHTMNTSKLVAIRRLAFAGALLATFAFPACTSVQVTNDNKPSIGEYKLGTLVVQSAHPFEKVREATTKAFKDLDYFLVKDEHKPDGGELKARDSHDTVFTVNLKGTGNTTEVKIRYGLKGELAPEQQLYQAIAKNL